MGICTTPLLKKADLDPADPKSFRSISNLSLFSKLLERIVAKQLVKYLKDNGLLPDLQSAYRAAIPPRQPCSRSLYLKENGILLDLQSAYRAGHSTETAVLKVLVPQGQWPPTGSPVSLQG